MVNMKLSSLFFVLILSGLISCTTDKRVNNEAVKKEMAAREIKKITEAEIVSKVHDIGSMIAMSTKKTLGKNLQQALMSGGVENAIRFCKINAMPLVDSLSRQFDASIKRVTKKARNPDDLPNDLESTILDAYEQQLNDSLKLQANVQKIDEANYLFTQPIFIDNALCLTCHGSLENGLTEETKNFIKEKYPDDKATGYAIGDLRGMWSITLSKKKIVQSF
jgi:hypothetical protein